MPMIDLKFSPGAVPDGGMTELAEGLTASLLEHRGAPDTAASRANVWLFARESPCLVGAKAPSRGHVVVTFTIVAGGMTPDHKERLVEDATGQIRRVAPEARVWALISEVADGNWGADGVITRLADAQAILGGARLASPGAEELTPHERRIARLVAEGRTNPEVAAALFNSRKTVEHHLSQIYRKLGVRSRTELARLLACGVSSAA